MLGLARQFSLFVSQEINRVSKQEKREALHFSSINEFKTIQVGIHALFQGCLKKLHETCHGRQEQSITYFMELFQMRNLGLKV